MSSIAKNLDATAARIRAAADAAGRSEEHVCLVAVSKTRPAVDLRQAFEAGQRHFGENYLQEALDKIDALADLPICWHFIGPIQSNKTRPIAEHFDWVHSVDRLKVARRLSEQRPAERPALNICLQVNISGEASKSGVLPAELPALARAVSQLPNLRLRGLMAIPAPMDSAAEQRQVFARMRQLLDALQRELPDLDSLSMGMSDDLDAAIAEGATLVRIGTAIFGARRYA